MHPQTTDVDVRCREGVKDEAGEGTEQCSDHKRYAAIYARVSTEGQGKSFSIPTQIEGCQKLAAHEGYIVPEGYVLIDEGISGTIHSVQSSDE